MFGDTSKADKEIKQFPRFFRVWTYMLNSFKHLQTIMDNQKELYLKPQIEEIEIEDNGIIMGENWEYEMSQKKEDTIIE